MSNQYLASVPCNLCIGQIPDDAHSVPGERTGRQPMRASDIRSFEPIRYGAYVCLSVPAAGRHAMADADVPALAERLGFRNEYGSEGGDPPDSVAYLRRGSAMPGQMTDAALLGAGAGVLAG